MDVARKIAAPLAGQNYVPSGDSKTTRLLIMVYWGTTETPEGTSSSVAYQAGQQASAALSVAKAASAGGSAGARAAEAAASSEYDAALQMMSATNARRDHLDFTNAQMLGYDSWWKATSGDVVGTAGRFDETR